jgi:hypothetical protein
MRVDEYPREKLVDQYDRVKREYWRLRKQICALDVVPLAVYQEYRQAEKMLSTLRLILYT